MRVLFLGWEYPPHISGGLGMACEGLTRGLSKLGVGIDFVMPHLSGREEAPHMRLWNGQESCGKPLSSAVSTWAIPAHLHPYLRSQPVHFSAASPTTTENLNAPNAPVANRYGANLFEEVARFSETAFEVADKLSFDVIHAHDWMTFPAGMAIARATGKPLVVHIHSLEQDRSGTEAGQETIKAVEQAGLLAAQRVIAVSYYTRKRINRFYGVPLERIQVVHNGIYPREARGKYRQKRKWAENVVLFLGRITYQKGPDYFVEAAAKVIPHLRNVTFVMAGSGDMLPQIRRQIADLGLTPYFEFTGFLNGPAVEQVFAIADLYVMPSVSEPFGITALEALAQDTPIVVSRQSGVSEVLNHALKFDYWDTDQLANLIIGGLTYPELRRDLIAMARKELKTLHWDAAALKTAAIYQDVIQSRLPSLSPTAPSWGV